MRYHAMGTSIRLFPALAVFAGLLMGPVAQAGGAEGLAAAVAGAATISSALADPAQSSAAAAQIRQIAEDADAPPEAREIYAAVFALQKAVSAAHGDLDAVRHKLAGAYAGGNAMAAFELGMLYGDDTDYKRHSGALSRRWIERAAQGGFLGAIMPLAGVLESRACLGHKQAVGQWWHWLRAGADANLHSAELEVARAYARGYLVADGCGKRFHAPGLAANPAKAAYWFEQGVSGASPGEIDAIADRFQNGYGVPQRLGEAVRLYKLESASGGDQGEGYNNAAWLLAGCPYLAQSHKGEAVDLAQRALAIDRNAGNADLTWTATLEDTLAGAYARDGDYRHAADTELRAIDLMQDARDAGEAKAALSRFRRRLAGYRRGRPWVMANHCRESPARSAFPATS